MEFVVSFIPVIIITVLLMPVGMFMYSTKGLGNQWLKAIGKTMEEIKAEDSNMGVIMGVTIGSSLITTYLIAVLVYSLASVSIVNLLLVISIVYFIVFFIRLKGSLFDGNIALFKVNLTATAAEFAVTFIIFMLFML